MTLPTLRRVFVDLSVHLLIAVACSWVIYAESGSVMYVFIFLLGGVLVDLDHCIDHLIFYKNTFKIREFLICSQLCSGRVYLFFHSWEFTLLILLAGILSGSYGLLLFSWALIIHLFVDNIQRKNLAFYFLIYRGIKKFDVSILLPELAI